MWKRKRDSRVPGLDLKTRMLIAAPAVMALFLASGCGGMSYANKSSASSSSSSGGSGFTGTGGGVPVNGNGTPTGTGSTGTGVAPLSFRVGAYGYTSTSVSASAGRVLKITFAPGQQDQTMQGSGYGPNYSGLGVYIAVGNLNQPTALLYNGFGNTQAERSSVMDYSSGLPKCGDGTNPACRQNVTITISQPNWDYDCLNFGYNCPWSHVDSGMPWHGTLQVQTDDTDPIQ